MLLAMQSEILCCICVATFRFADHMAQVHGGGGGGHDHADGGH